MFKLKIKIIINKKANLINFKNFFTNLRVSELNNSPKKPLAHPTKNPAPTAQPICPNANSNIPLPFSFPSGRIYCGCDVLKIDGSIFKLFTIKIYYYY